MAEEILVYGIIGDPWDGLSSARFAERLQAIEPTADLLVRINSPGGMVFEGLAIYSLLKGRVGRTDVVIDGVAASMASLIAMAGETIAIAPAAMMMIHNPWTVSVGDAPELRKDAAVLDKIGAQMAGVYAAQSGKSAEDVAAIMAAETWYTAAEAVEAGFADSTLEHDDEPAALAARMKRAPDLAAFGFRNAPQRVAALLASASNPAAPPANPASKGDPMSQNAPGGETAAQIEAAKAEAAKAAATAERERITGIGKAVAAAKLPQSLADKLISDGTSLDAARAQVIDALAAAGAQQPTTHPQVTGGDDAADKFVKGAALALLQRAGMKGGERNEFSGFTLRELAREALGRRNIAVVGLDAMAMVGRAFAPRAEAGMHSTSDFVNVLANVANKAMLKGFDEAEEVYSRFTRAGSLSDFKPSTRVALNLFPSLAEVPEGGEYTYGTMSDRKSAIALATYGKMFAITRQAIINDDLSVFTQVPGKMGRAANRTVGNLVWALITGNVVLDDGVALFHATHANLGTAGAPTVAKLEELRKLMALQKDPDQHTKTGLNIQPAFVLSPVGLRSTLATLLASEFDPAATQRVPNTARGMAELITDARLDAASATAYYTVADPNRWDTIEVAYLDGVQTPTLEQRDGWNVDGVEFKVRMDAGVKAHDHRGLAKNAG